MPEFLSLFFTFSKVVFGLKGWICAKSEFSWIGGERGEVRMFGECEREMKVSEKKNW